MRAIFYANYRLLYLQYAEEFEVCKETAACNNRLGKKKEPAVQGLIVLAHYKKWSFYNIYDDWCTLHNARCEICQRS